MNDLTHFFHIVPKTVFVTGGMSGIGYFLAKTLVSCGCNVAVLDQCDDEKIFKTLLDKRQTTNQLVRYFQFDVCDPQMVTEVIGSAVTSFGCPNLVIHCAGILKTAPFRQLDYRSFQQVIDVNLMGSRNVAAASLPYLEPGSHLVLFASLAGIVGTYTQAAYAASKFGVVGLAEVLRLELAQEGIDVSVICPGEVSTPLLAAERQHGSPITQKLNSIAGVLTVEQAGRAILKGIGARQFMITPGYRAWFIREFARKASGIFRWLTDLKLSRANRLR